MIEQHRERLFRVALGLLGEATEAEEATQETFVQVFHRLESFRAGSSLYTWACRICINLCLRRRERRQATRQRELSLDDVEHPDRLEALVRGTSPEDDLLRGELADHVREQLRALPDEYQGVLVLREIDGLSYEEIAQALGIGIGTVKSRVHRGRSLLRNRLADYVYGVNHAS